MLALFELYESSKLELFKILNIQKNSPLYPQPFVQCAELEILTKAPILVGDLEDEELIDIIKTGHCNIAEELDSIPDSQSKPNAQPNAQPHTQPYSLDTPLLMKSDIDKNTPTKSQLMLRTQSGSTIKILGTGNDALIQASNVTCNEASKIASCFLSLIAIDKIDDNSLSTLTADLVNVFVQLAERNANTIIASINQDDLDAALNTLHEKINSDEFTSNYDISKESLDTLKNLIERKNTVLALSKDTSASIFNKFLAFCILIFVQLALFLSCNNVDQTLDSMLMDIAKTTQIDGVIKTIKEEVQKDPSSFQNYNFHIALVPDNSTIEQLITDAGLDIKDQSIGGCLNLSATHNFSDAKQQSVPNSNISDQQSTKPPTNVEKAVRINVKHSNANNQQIDI